VHHSGSSPRDEAEDARRVQLVEVTIDSLAEVGYVGTTLAEIARRAGVSPGLVAHYFDDKDGLLEAAFRTLARARSRRGCGAARAGRTPRGRCRAVIDTNLAPEEFDKAHRNRMARVWASVARARSETGANRLPAPHVVEPAQRSAPMISGEDARSLAAMIAAMIDGVWLRAALSEWQEADSESRGALLTAFVEGRLRELAAGTGGAHGDRACGARHGRCRRPLQVINPANGRCSRS